MDFSILKEIGLTNGEIKVYLASLELGPSTSGPLIERSGVARSIIYQILQKLIEKGLVSYITKEKTKYYHASQPSKILDYIEEKEKQLQETKKKVIQIIPELITKQSKKKSEGQIFEGFRGIQTAHEHVYSKLSRGDEYFYLGIPPFQEEKYHAYWLKDHQRREKAGISCRLLFNKETNQKILRNRNKFKKCDARYMPIDIKTPAWFMGYKDIAVIGLQSERGIAVEMINQEIASSFKAYFEAFWKLSKSLK